MVRLDTNKSNIDIFGEILLIFSNKWHLANKSFKDRYTQTVDVNLVIVWMSIQYFWCHI